MSDQNSPVSSEKKEETVSPAVAEEEPVEDWKKLMFVTMAKRFLAEMIGTAVLVIIGCGAAMGLSLSGTDTIGLGVGTAFAFGLVVLALSYALGEYSGCHLNPAVTWALYLNHKIGARQMIWYWVAQFCGGVLGGAVLLAFFGHGNAGTPVVQTLASNTVNMSILCSSWNVVDSATNAAPVLYSAQGWPFMFIGLGAEMFFAFVFVFTILCTGHKKEYSPISGLALGLSLTSVVLLGFNITGTGVNPARSFGTAIMALANGQTEPIAEYWIFLVGPMLGATIAVLAYRAIWHKHGAHAPHSRHNVFHKQKSDNK